MDRVLRGAAETISATWYDADGVIANPGTVTLGIEREDGTVLVAAGAASVGTGAAKRTFALTPTHTASLDLLKVTWTGSTLGSLVTYVEVVGGFLCSITEMRKLSSLDDDTKYPIADLVVARTLAETALEDACGVAFVPRYRRDMIDHRPGSRLLLLKRPRPTAVRSITRDGIAFSDAQLANIKLRPTGSLYSMTGWPIAYRSYYEVAYEHGYPYPPPRVAQAARMLAKRWLIESPYDDRATSMTTEDGTFSLVTPGMRGAMFDLPEVNVVVAEYSYIAALVG